MGCGLFFVCYRGFVTYSCSKMANMSTVTKPVAITTKKIMDIIIETFIKINACQSYTGHLDGSKGHDDRNGAILSHFA